MEFEQTREWWGSTSPLDSRPNYDLTPNELKSAYGGCGYRGWLSRVARGKELTLSDGGPVLSWRKLKVGGTDVRNPHVPPTQQGIDSTELTAYLAHGAHSVVDIADHFDCSPSRVEQALEQLRSNHLLVQDTAAGVVLSKTIERPDMPHIIDSRQFVETLFPIGFCADLHIGSKYERLDVLNDLADRWVSEGVKDVYCAGNWIDGSGRKFNEHDIYVHGAEEQVSNFCEVLPQREGLRWNILSGDDHEGWFVQDCHVNIGRELEAIAREMGRDDISDLGYMERDVDFVQDHGSARLRIIHAGGGSSYATSYTSQKYVETLQGGEKPQAVIVGHFHKWDWCSPREVDVIQAMCCQDQTPFMRKKRLQAHLGGGIMEIRQNELGIFTGMKVNKFQFFDKKFYAYRWRRP